MSNSTTSPCFAPFLNVEEFPYKGGLEGSRLCAPLSDSLTCCLPCPMTDWVYPDNYLDVANAANWVALGSVLCCCFLLLSFAVLPVQKTSRHYLSICLVSAILLCCLSFVVPLGAQPDQCFDAITPHDMRSDTACAFSGALVVFGGFASVTWVFLRSLSVFLQICYQIVPGKKFLYGSLLAGWGVPAIILALALGLSGVSYRFGNICHINHDYSLGSFWGPMLGVAGLTGIIQFITFGYCIRVYLRSVMDAGTTSVTSSNLQSYTGSTKTVSARAAYRRVRKVIAMQWRGIMVVLILIISVVYFSVTFITMDSMTAKEIENPTAAMPWIRCILINGGDKNKCLDLADSLVLSEPTVMAVLFLIASFGFWAALFLGRVAMITGWIGLLKQPFTKKREFISVDAGKVSDQRTYEMLTSPPPRYHIAKGPGGLVATATTDVTPIAVESSAPRALSPSPIDGFSPVEIPKAANADRRPSVNFSHPHPHPHPGPRQMDPTASGPTRIRLSRDGLAAAPLKEWRSPTPDRAMEEGNSYFYAPSSSPPPNQQRISNLSNGRPAQVRAGSALSNSSIGRAGSPTSPSTSPTPFQRSGSLASRDWDPASTHARGNYYTGPL